MVKAAIAVTGARGFRRGEETYVEGVVEDALRNLKFVPTEFITGACWGIDTLAARLAWRVWPDAKHRIVVPNAAHNEGLVAEAAENAAAGRHKITVEFMPRGTNYMDRNDRMVALAELMLGFPSTKTEVQRSGTWATIRRARKANVPLLIFPLDGEAAWAE